MSSEVRFPEDSGLTTTTLMTPEMANFSGNVHGGHILRLVDQIAYACSSQYAGKYCVTLSVDRVVFKVPVKVGDLVTMKARVNHTGRTSLQVGVRVEARDLKGGEIRHTNSCFLTMVATEDGSPVPVPKLHPQTAEDVRRFERAALGKRQAAIVERVAAGIQEYHSLVELSAVAILLIDRESGLVRVANPTACSLLERSETDIEESYVWEHLVHNDRERAMKFIETVARDTFIDPLPLPWRTGTGGERVLKVLGWLVPLPNQQLVQIILRPISDESTPSQP